MFKNPWIGVAMAGLLALFMILLKRMSVGYFILLVLLVILSFAIPPVGIGLGVLAVLFVLVTEWHPMGKALRQRTGGML